MDASRARTVIVGALIVALFATLVARLWFLQVVDGPRLAVQAEEQGVQITLTDAPRGRILDREGRVLVDNRIARTVTVDRDVYRELDGPERNNLMARLSEVLGRRKSTLERRMNSDRYDRLRPVPVAEDIPEADAIWLSEHLDDFPGVQVETTAVREYPYGTTASHVLGYAGEISEDELDARRSAGYRQGDLIGKTGVEAAYEADLRGRTGQVPLLVDARGRVIGQVGEETPPIAGRDVQLTLDVDIQRAAEQQLADQMEMARRTCTESDCSEGTFRAPVGCVVVLDARTGGVVAMASNPTYDPSQFVGGITADELADLNNEANHYPLLNYCSQGEYAPGSVFKPFTAIAGIRAGVIGRTSNIADPTGFFSYGGNEDTYANFGRRATGNPSLYQALVKSVNVYFYTIGARIWEQSPPVDETIQAVAREYGFDSPTGIEIAERPGRVPDKAWLTDIHNAHPQAFPNDTWLGGYTVHLSIGQSELLVTPLQLARAYAALSQGTELPTPHVGGVVTAAGDPTDVVRTIAPPPTPMASVAPDDLALIMDALRGVVRDSGSNNGGFTGTAFATFDGQFPLAQHPVAGKTGTAQRAGHQTTSLFAGIVPADGTEYVVVSIVEESGTGATTAVPIVRDVMRVIVGEDEPPPDPVAEAEAADGTGTSDGTGTTDTTVASDAGDDRGTPSSAPETTTTEPPTQVTAGPPSGRRVPGRRRRTPAGARGASP